MHSKFISFNDLDLLNTSIKPWVNALINPPLHLLVCCSLIFILFGCSKSDGPVTDSGSEVKAGHISGMGPSNQALKGSAFTMSSTIGIQGGIKAADVLYPGEGYCQVVGSGAFVLITMDLVNNTGKDTLLIFPAGLTFASKSTEDQNGILIQNTEVHLSKGGTCNTLFYAYCTNQHRHGSSVDSQYSFGPICDAAPIKEIIQLLAGKKVNLDPGEQPNIAGPIGTIQTLVWKITDGTGLTDEDKVRINALKDK